MDVSWGGAGVLGSSSWSRLSLVQPIHAYGTRTNSIYNMQLGQSAKKSNLDGVQD